MPHAPRPGIQVVPYVGRARPGGADAPPEPRAGARSCAAGLRWATLLAVASFLVDLVGASQAHSMSLAISAVQSAGQVLTAGAALLVARHGPSSAARAPFDPSRVAALASLLSGLVLLILSMPIAYRALASLVLPGDCDVSESACILALGLCSSAASLWLILRAEPETAAPGAAAWGTPGMRRPDAMARRPARADLVGDVRRGAFADLIAGHVVDVRTSATLLAAILVSALSGWGWVDALAGLAGAFLMSVAAARVVVGSGAVLIEARPADRPNRAGGRDEPPFTVR